MGPYHWSRLGLYSGTHSGSEEDRGGDSLLPGDKAPESSLSKPSRASASLPCTLRCFLREEGWV